MMTTEKMEEESQERHEDNQQEICNCIIAII